MSYPRTDLFCDLRDGDVARGVAVEHGDGIMALARVIGTIGGDVGNFFNGRDLAEQFGQHRHIAAADIDRPNLRCFLVDPEMDLAPDTALGKTSPTTCVASSSCAV